MKLIIYTDGASRGNPGKASFGFTICDGRGELIYQQGKYIGITTNNVAEYTAVLESLKWIKENIKDNLSLEYFADSKLVVEQLSGRFKVKSPHLKPIIEEIRGLALGFGGVLFTHIPREQNTAADKLANIALDALKR